MNKDVLDQIAEDARRLRVARMLPDGNLPWEWVQRVQADLVEFMDSTGMAATQISRSMGEGYSPATLSAFRNLKSTETFVGDLDRITRGINQWLETAARKREVPRPKGWIETDVAKKMLNLIARTIETRSIGLIYSDAGRGKTMTLEAAAGIYPGAIMIRVICSARGPFGLAKLLAHHLKLKGAFSTLQIQLKLIDRLAKSDRPILIDEAHQLSEAAIEFLRDLHDTCAVPMVFAGTRGVQDKFSDFDMFFGQLSSRVGLRYDVTEQLSRCRRGSPRPLHTVAEIRKLFHSDKLRLTDDGAAALAKLANLEGMGGLRLCNQVVMAAASICAGAALDASLVFKILRQMHGIEFSQDRIERAVEESTLAVA